MPILKVHHTTVYRYRQPVGFGPHRMMLRPRESHDQRLLDCALAIIPKPASIEWNRDAFDNWVGVACFTGHAEELRFESRIEVEQTTVHPASDRDVPAKTWAIRLDAADMADFGVYLGRDHEDAAIARFARRFAGEGKAAPMLAALTSMTHAIREDFVYVRRTEKGVQAPLETLETGRGTCRDFAVLMIDAVRSLGLPARFVSGYLYVPPRDPHHYHGGGSTHAWVQVHLPGAGWVDFDPTNAIVGNRDMIRVAVAPGPREALPLTGTFSGFPSDFEGMTVTVRVEREIGAGREQKVRDCVA